MLLQQCGGWQPHHPGAEAANPLQGRKAIPGSLGTLGEGTWSWGCMQAISSTASILCIYNNQNISISILIDNLTCTSHVERGESMPYVLTVCHNVVLSPVSGANTRAQERQRYLTNFPQMWWVLT